jgi:hypothetical protein
LEKLVTNECLDKIESDPMLGNNVFVYFSHFTEIDFIPTKETLSKLLARGSALKVKVNQRGIDLLVPTFKDNVLFGVLLIQVKNKEKDKNRKTNIDKLCLANIFGYNSDLLDLHAIGIYMALRENSSKKAFVTSCDLPQPPTVSELFQKLQNAAKTGSSIYKKTSKKKQQNEDRPFANVNLSFLSQTLDINFQSRANFDAYIISKNVKRSQNNIVLFIPSLYESYLWMPTTWKIDLQAMLNTQITHRVLAIADPICVDNFYAEWQNYRSRLNP